MRDNYWKVIAIGDEKICREINPGFACGKKDIEDGVPHLRMNNISTYGTINFDLIRRIPRETAEKQNRWLQPSDILFCNTNSTELVGKTSLFSGWNEQCTYSNHLTRLRCNTINVMPKWLALWLQQLWSNKYFALNCKEFVGQSAFANEKLKKVEIPVPPLDEQRRIVARIEELTQRTEEARRILREVEEELISFTPALLAKAFRGEL
jgi:type I restriction enzyme S subunit